MRPNDSKTIKNIYAGKSSAAKARKLVAWFSSSVEGCQALSDMLDRDAYLIEEELDLQNRPSEFQSEKMLEQINGYIRKQRIRRHSIKAAAILLPFFLLAGLTFYTNRQADLFGQAETAELYVPKGKKAHIFFQDGSEVILNADSKIRYPKKFGLFKRKLQLEGEAYFNVASNKFRPLELSCENLCVEVLGTSFNVSAYENDKKIRVVLDEGKIIFHDRKSQNQQKLSPGQQITYNKATGSYSVEHLAKSSDASLWKEDILHLQDCALNEVLKILERRYDISFTVRHPLAHKFSFTLTTQETLLQNILKELQKIAPLQFKIQGKNCEVYYRK